MATKKDFHKIIIGRSEELSFVDFDAKHIPAKTDTGAYRSAIHADHIHLDKAGHLYFRILGGHPVCGAMATDVVTDQYKIVHVANSFGDREQRYEVRLRVKLGSRIFTAPFTLANRSKKIYPILLGRKLLNDRFLVDTSSSSINRVELKEKYNIDFTPDEEEGRPKTTGGSS